MLSAPRTDPYLRLVWGFHCQGCASHHFSCCCLIFCSTRGVGILPFRPHVTIAVALSECQRLRFFSAAKGLVLDAREHGGTLPVSGWLPHDDPRGACHWPRAIANHACIRLNPYRVPTMKQSYASAGKAPRRRVHSPSGIVAIAVCGLPLPRIVIGHRASKRS